MVTIIVAVNHGLGHHAATLSDHDLIVYGKTVFVQAMLTTTTSLCLLKLSVGFSLLRLSSPMNRWWRRTIVGLMSKKSSSGVTATKLCQQADPVGFSR
jgi:hypothetical protein